MRKIVCSLVLSITFLGVYGQQEWNWPEEGTDFFSDVQEQQAFYKVNLQLEEWEKAWTSLQWLYENRPELHPSIYKDAVKVVEKILEAEGMESARTPGMEDSLLWIFDRRIELFDESTEIVDRKAYTAFKRYYKYPSRYALLDELFSDAYAASGDNMSTFMLTPYMSLAKFYHQSRPEEMPAEKVLDIHGKISAALEAKAAAGSETPAQIKKEQDKVDALLTSIGNILSCEFIEETLVPKLEANPEDLNVAKKIFTYSLKAKCSDQPYFTAAGEVIYENDPTYNLAAALGNKYMASDEYGKALEYFTRSNELAGSDEERYESYINQASALAKMGQKVNARKMALNALSVKPGDTKAYNIIGNLYFTSFDDCRSDESKVMDRAVFIAAYNMYEKAGNQEQMAATMAQFPSKEEIFNEGYEQGDVVDLGCWIGESVALKTRD